MYKKIKEIINKNKIEIIEPNIECNIESCCLKKYFLQNNEK